MFECLSSGQCFLFGMLAGICLVFTVIVFIKAYKAGMFQTVESESNEVEMEEWLEPIMLEQNSVS